MASKAAKRRAKKAFAAAAVRGEVAIRTVDGRRVVLTGVAFQPERWGPVRERPVSKRARAWVVDVLAGKGLIGPEAVAAGREIAAVFAQVTGSQGARAANLDASGGGGCAEISASIAMIKARRYDPWCDALGRIQKLGGAPMLGVTFDRVCLQLSVDDVARAHRLRKATIDSYVVEALNIYVSMGRARRKPAILRKGLDDGNDKTDVSLRSRQPRQDDEAQAA